MIAPMKCVPGYLEENVTGKKRSHSDNHENVVCNL